MSQHSSFRDMINSKPQVRRVHVVQELTTLRAIRYESAGSKSERTGIAFAVDCTEPPTGVLSQWLSSGEEPSF